MRLKGLTLATATAFAVAVPPAGAQRTLGATFFIPMVVVPALLVSHVMIFIMLLRGEPSSPGNQD